MSHPLELASIATGFLWPAIYVAIAVAAFVRLRATAAGLLTGGGTLLVALRVLVLSIYFRFERPTPHDPSYFASQIGSLGFTLVAFALITAGIALIPAALKRLGAEAATRPATF